MERYDVSASRDQYPDLDLSPEDFVFICVGRLEKIKGHDVLMKAFGKMKSMRGVKLLIVGDGPVREEIENHVREQGLQHMVRMLGHRNDIPYLLNLSDCFVLSSRSEGLSCSIIEAMAAGLPVIATDVGGNSELVTDDVNGYLVPSENPDVLSKRMQIMIQDTTKRQNFAEMSLNRAREHYSLDSMMEKYLDNYNLMIENSRKNIKH
jgi:glycosyltransferase involved in cell wall biosynthesis